MMTKACGRTSGRTDFDAGSTSGSRVLMTGAVLVSSVTGGDDVSADGGSCGADGVAGCITGSTFCSTCPCDGGSALHVVGLWVALENRVQLFHSGVLANFHMLELLADLCDRGDKSGCTLHHVFDLFRNRFLHCIQFFLNDL